MSETSTPDYPGWEGGTASDSGYTAWIDYLSLRCGDAMQSAEELSNGTASNSLAE